MDAKQKKQLMSQLRALRDELDALMQKHASRLEYDMFALKAVPALDNALLTLSE